jgi:hypothetical protein
MFVGRNKHAHAMERSKHSLVNFSGGRHGATRAARSPDMYLALQMELYDSYAAHFLGSGTFAA